MSGREIVWALGLLGVLLAALTRFRRLRRPTVDYQQSAVVQARLPKWVKLFESSMICAFVVASMIGATLLVCRFSPGLLREPNGVTGASAIYFFVGTTSIAIPLSFLCANVVGWLIPPVREANLAAMDGTSVSYWSANRGLLLYSAVSMPLGLLLTFIAVLSPWRT